MSDQQNQTNPSAGQRGETASDMRDQRSSTVDMDPTLASGSVHIGFITHTNPLVGSAIVRIGGVAEKIACVFGELSSCDYSVTGTGTSNYPPAGTGVVVMLPYGPKSVHGIILCALHPTFGGDEKNKERKPTVAFTDHEAGAGITTESAYRELVDDPENPETPQAQGGRPLDQLPGASSAFNNWGGFDINTDFFRALGASQGAQMQFYMLDNMVRLIADQFQKWSATGDTHDFADFGYGTLEFEGTPHECERYGELKETNWLQTNQIAAEELTKQGLVPKNTEDLARKRIHLMLGHLGSVLGAWLSVPDPDTPHDTPSAKPIDRGVLQLSVGDNGRVMLNQAGGLFIERSDRIVVPMRRRQPNDPEGDKVEESDPAELKEPFELDPEHPEYTSLWMEDYRAWERKLAVQRLEELNKDFYVPEDEDLKEIPDTYDKNGVDGKELAKEDFQKFKGRRFTFWEGKDGSGGMRDDLGAEVVLAGGRIRFNAPNGIEFVSGQDVLVFAGKDFVAKAHDSVDISSQTKDLRMKAQGNLQALAVDSALVLESQATGDGLQGEGEAATGGGIQLVAPDSTVSARGKSLMLSGKDKITFKYHDDGNGNMIISMKSLTAIAKKVLIASGKHAALSLFSGSATLAGRSVSLAAQSGLTLLRGNKAWVPFTELPIQVDLYSRYQQLLETVVSQYVDQDTWLGRYTDALAEHIRFKFRKPEECTPGEDRELRYPEPYFAADMRRESETYEDWEPEELDEITGKSWPGDDEATILLQLDEEFNIKADRKLTERAGRKSKGGPISEQLFRKLPRLQQGRTR